MSKYSIRQSESGSVDAQHFPSKGQRLDMDYTKKGIIHFVQVDHAALIGAGVPSSYIQKLEEGFWEFTLSTHTENHSEGKSQRRVLSDTNITYSTGAMPINHNVTGYLNLMDESDHRLDFLYYYHNVLRGTMCSRLGLQCVLVIRDTVTRLSLTSLVLNTSARLQDKVTFTLTGIGQAYNARKAPSV